MGNKGYLAHSISYPFISVQNICTFKTIHWQFKYLSCMTIPVFTPEYKHLRLLFHLLIFFELSDNINIMSSRKFISAFDNVNRHSTSTNNFVQMKGVLVCLYFNEPKWWHTVYKYVKCNFLNYLDLCNHGVCWFIFLDVYLLDSGLPQVDWTFSPLMTMTEF